MNHDRGFDPRACPESFEVWARVHAMLLKRSAAERAAILDELGIADVWQSADRKWSNTLSDDISLERWERPELLNRICSDELRKRRSTETQPSGNAPRPDLVVPSVGAEMSLEEYASLQAECDAVPENRERLWLRFGINDAAAKERLDQRFERLFAADPQLRGQYHRLLSRYRQWLLERRGG